MVRVVEGVVRVVADLGLAAGQARPGDFTVAERGRIGDFPEGTLTLVTF